MIEKNLRKKLLINFLLVFSIFLIDRLSKIYVIFLNKKYSGSEIFSSKFLNISLIWNEGIAFGLFSLSNNYLYNSLTTLILIIIGVISFMLINSQGIKKYLLLMILGGALGNVYDRIFNKAVPDFIDFHVGNFHWFIFNVADVFISIGVFFMILVELFDKNKNVHQND
tara:strand:- start:122 stop:625 length:504 start_codon:yes stop_codon:yes gene_type:complete